MAVVVGSVLTVLATSAGPALAAPSPSPLPIPVPPAVAPSTVCTIDNGSNGAAQLTGLVATHNGYVAIDGFNPSWSLRVFYFDSNCNRTNTQSYPTTPKDPEDLAVDSKGVLWIADIGDDADAGNPTRTLVSLWKVTSQSSMTHYKFSYPDGPHNAGAFVLNGNGDPIFITKEVTGPAHVYTFSGTLSTSQTMPLTKAGDFQPEQTGTANKLGNRGFAQNEVTGGANAPGGNKVALRTFTDAYEWDVTNGDVLGAILHGKPRITAMPNEDQGYAIAYTADGSAFLTVSDGPGPTPILKYTPATPAAASAAAHKPKGPPTPSALRKWFNQLTFRQLMLLLGGVAIFGLLLLLIGILGIRRSRDAFRAAEARAARTKKAAAGKASAPVPAGVGGGGVYGAPRAPGPSGGGAGAVYGVPQDPYAPPPASPPPAGGHRGTPGVYGGGQYGPPADPYADGGPDDRRPSPYGRPDDHYPR
jgi:hypothetical protein